MNFKKYENPIKLPQIPSVNQGIQIMVKKCTLEQAIKHIDEWKAHIIDYYHRREEYDAKHKEYDSYEASIYNNFKSDVLEELGLTNHPKADLLFEKAWERGHSYGYEEVWNAAQDLSDLLVD